MLFIIMVCLAVGIASYNCRHSDSPVRQDNGFPSIHQNLVCVRKSEVVYETEKEKSCAAEVAGGKRLKRVSSLQITGNE
jgi:hypothetical protein